jgi:precorrin-6Y C5,15-methyltransferase (decarboxylating)
VGMGNPNLLTGQAREAVAASDRLIGAQRMLDCFPDYTKEKICAAVPDKISQAITKCGKDERIAILLSGDCGFYSAARGLEWLSEGAAVRHIPGISSLQYFCAQLGTGWEDVYPLSLHGRDADLIGIVSNHPRTFLLTGGKWTVKAICERLCEHGFGNLLVQVGERLSYPEEQITRGEARVLCHREFDSLAVMLIHNGSIRGKTQPATCGLPDEWFLRTQVPMTKSEVRAVSLSKLWLRQGMTVWDVGAGTGSVAIEAARMLSGSGLVCAVEKEKEALALIEQNRLRFNLHNLNIIAGRAPAALRELPIPDAVFVGGSSGGISAILRDALERNPKVRLVVNAITLETVGATLDCFNEAALPNQEAVQLSVARAKLVGANHMMMGQNPIYILSAGGKAGYGIRDL